ncbi:MAG: hypothetical protein GC159_21255 [Phycisphaera sp.]|nr:hypothetical protein [Phycisphaera sp.]
MAEPVIAITKRRALGGSLALVAIVAIGVLMLSRGLALRDTAFFSGWLLLLMCLFLALYNLRKKLTYPPLMRSATWLQLHVYVGLVSIAVFVMHSGFKWPTGAFETLLWLFYTGTAASGLLGLYITRTFPPFLTRRDEEIIFERIPRLRREVREQAEALIVESVKQADTTTLSDFYAKSLATYFATPRNYWHHVFESRVPVKRMCADLKRLDRYLCDKEKAIAAQLDELIRAKDNLDYHWAVQGTLKGWLFIHIPLTYGLLLFAVVHAVLVHAFDGSVS